MNIGNAIYSILNADTTIRGIVTDKIFPVDAPDQRAFPYITYQVISTTPHNNKDRAPSITTLRLQIDVFAQTYQGVQTLADAVNNALSFYYGTVSDINIDIIVFEDENDLHDPKSKIYRKEQDYMIRTKSN